MAALASEGWLEVAGLSASTVQRVSGQERPKLNYSVVHLSSVAFARETLQRKYPEREIWPRHASRGRIRRSKLSLEPGLGRGNPCKDSLIAPTNQGMQLSTFNPTTRR